MTTHRVPFTALTEALAALPSTECVLWSGLLDPAGYGRGAYDYKNVAAHRLVYALTIGPIPDGLELDHACEVHACVNPAHLEPVTGAENKRRVAIRQRGYDPLKECIRGHPRIPENDYIPPSGSRGCRPCRTEDGRRCRDRKRLQEVAS